MVAAGARPVIDTSRTRLERAWAPLRSPLKVLTSHEHGARLPRRAPRGSTHRRRRERLTTKMNFDGSPGRRQQLIARLLAHDDFLIAT
jgi:hypothetical protein